MNLLMIFVTLFCSSAWALDSNVRNKMQELLTSSASTWEANAVSKMVKSLRNFDPQISEEELRSKFKCIMVNKDGLACGFTESELRGTVNYRLDPYKCRIENGWCPKESDRFEGLYYYVKFYHKVAYDKFGREASCRFFMDEMNYVFPFDDPSVNYRLAFTLTNTHTGRRVLNDLVVYDRPMIFGFEVEQPCGDLL